MPTPLGRGRPPGAPRRPGLCVSHSRAKLRRKSGSKNAQSMCVPSAWGRVGRPRTHPGKRASHPALRDPHPEMPWEMGGVPTRWRPGASGGSTCPRSSPPAPTGPAAQWARVCQLPSEYPLCPVSSASYIWLMDKALLCSGECPSPAPCPVTPPAPLPAYPQTPAPHPLTPDCIPSPRCGASP